MTNPRDLIGWALNKDARPVHRGGLAGRYEARFTNLTKDEAARVMELLNELQQTRAAQ